MNRRALIAFAFAIALLAIGGPFLAISLSSNKTEPKMPVSDSARAAAGAFLDRYVDPDGRVVRRDQGNDSVSEGQAYAMLLSVAIGDKTRFDAVWNWSLHNLMQPNGLMAWRWANGAVVDTHSAADADTDTARALVLAAQKFNDNRYGDQAGVLAKAIADNEIVYPADGKPVLVAGPWARNAPYVTNPSYHSPQAEQQLGAYTTDKRWPALQSHERDLTEQLIGTTTKNVKLPPNWALVDESGAIRASGPPENPGGAPSYSYDAFRLPVRLAESCDKADRDQAVRLWTVLQRSRDSRTSVGLTLAGQVTDHSKTPEGAVAAAAGAHATGNQDEASRMLDIGEQLDSTNHTYFGDAWVALGRVMLTTNWLGSC